MSENPALEELIEMYLERRRIGDAPEIKVFASEHPECSAELLELLPLMLDMEGLGVEKTLKIQPAASLLPELNGSDYRLLRKIGSGGMGAVYEALQVSLNRKVAVKLLLPSLLQNSVQREQFENEARVIAMLHHPNIVRILNAGCCSGQYYYAMELIDGKGLDQCEFHNLREIAEVGLQAARALAYAHRCKVMHRDIKPANIFLDSERNVHVGDFGLAFVLQEDKDSLAEGDSQSGTIRYMPPERLVKKISSFASDQYSFGATLYELIAKSPFLPERTPKELIQRICRGDIPPLKCAEPDLAAIVNRSIRFREEDRYPDMDALAGDLLRFLNHEPVAAVRASLWKRLRLWAKRKPAVAALSVFSCFCVLALVAALGVGYLRTSAALKLAERNAATADAALSNVFSHIERQTPSAEKSALLTALLPYYQEISIQRNLPKTKQAEVNRMVGICALRSGNFALAEKAFRRFFELSGNPDARNFLAEALRKQGKKEEADRISRDTAERFSGSAIPAERLAAVRALQTLSTDPASGEIRQAFALTMDLLTAEPDNPDYRFEYAVMLGKNPRIFQKKRIPGVVPNASVLLNELAHTHADRPEYGLALMDLMDRKLHYAGSFRQEDWEMLETALKLSDQLLGRFPNTPDVVEKVVRFRTDYITSLRHRGDLTAGRRESERLTAMLEILFHNPETPDSVKGSLIQLQLERLTRLRGNDRADAARQAEEKITNELKRYHGPDKEKFQQQLREMK